MVDPSDPDNVHQKGKKARAIFWLRGIRFCAANFRLAIELRELQPNVPNGKRAGKVELRPTGFVGIKPAILLVGPPKCPGFRLFVWSERCFDASHADGDVRIHSA